MDRDLQSIKEACEIQHQFERKGFIVINPFIIKSKLETELGRIAFEKEIIGAEIKALSGCDAMILIPEWEKSKRCNLHIRFALDCNLSIYDYESMEKIHFNSRLNNSVLKTSFDNWITQPIHIE